jgi:hypothetical protein
LGAIEQLRAPWAWDIESDDALAVQLGHVEILRKLVAVGCSFDPCNCDEPAWAKQSERRAILRANDLRARLDAANVKLDAIRALWDGTPYSVGAPNTVPSVTDAQWCAGFTYFVAQLFKDAKSQLDSIFKTAIERGEKAIEIGLLAAGGWQISAVSSALALPEPAATLLLPAVAGEGTAVALVPVATIAATAALVIAALGAVELALVYNELTEQDHIEQVACLIAEYMRGKTFSQANMIAAWQYASDNLDLPLINKQAMYVCCQIAKLYLGNGTNFEMQAIAMSSAVRLAPEIASAICPCDTGLVYIFTSAPYNDEWLANVGICGWEHPAGNWYTAEGWADADIQCGTTEFYSGLDLTLTLPAARSMTRIVIDYAVNAPSNASLDGGMHLRAVSGGSDIASTTTGAGVRQLVWTGSMMTDTINIACNSGGVGSAPVNGDVFVRKIVIT